MTAARPQKSLAIAMVAIGLFQAAFALTQENLAWSTFFVLFGGSLAIIGVASLWVERGGLGRRADA